MDTSLEWKIVVGRKRFTRGKTSTIMEESSDWLHEKQKHVRKYGTRQTFLAFKNGETAFSCIDPNNNNNSNKCFSNFLWICCDVLVLCIFYCCQWEFLIY